ncbi:MAG: class I SAM-dependent methyltransferase [Phycicoccus sp.]|nr:class I SAM-dependent methyltransferase [Phycicoccus sp.]
MTERLHRFAHRHRTPSGGGLFDHPHAYDLVSRWLVGPLHRRVVADARLAVSPERGSILDIGTGPGRLPILLAQALAGCTVEGLDPSEAMIGEATARAAGAQVAGRVTFRVGSVESLPQADGTVDLVVSTASLHHWPEPSAGIAEIARVLRPGGRALIYDPMRALRQAATATAADGLRIRIDPLFAGFGRLELVRLETSRI